MVYKPLKVGKLLFINKPTHNIGYFGYPTAERTVGRLGRGHPFAQCHRTNDGQFLVAWFGGTHEKHNDVGIWLSKGTPQYWSAPVEVAKLREDPHWNPVLFTAPSG